MRYPNVKKIQTLHELKAIGPEFAAAGEAVRCRERLGGLLHFYHQEAAYPGGKVLDVL